MMLIAFHTSHSLHTKGHSGAEKSYSNFLQSFYFPNAPICMKVLCNDCITSQLNKQYPKLTHIAEKQDFKGQNLYFNLRISIQKDQYHHPRKETQT